MTIVPLVGYVMPIILGFKGNEWAWQNKRWKSIDHFKNAQKRWAIWGSCIVILLFVSFSGLFFFAFHTSEPITGKHVDSVDWLPPSATDISYYKRDGFGWIKNYECSIPEDDFLSLAPKKRDGSYRRKITCSFMKNDTQMVVASPYIMTKTQNVFLFKAVIDKNRKHRTSSSTGAQKNRAR